MGADMIGYVLVRPAKGADKIAKKQIAKIETVLSNTKLTDEKKVAKLLNANVELDFSHDVEEMSDAEFVETVKGLIESVNLNVDGRDLMSRYAKVRGREIEILSAGDMSWGGEPDGYAYNLLKTYVQLGISDAWENALTK
jgi:hypothetical protein